MGGKVSTWNGAWGGERVAPPVKDKDTDRIGRQLELVKYLGELEPGVSHEMPCEQEVVARETDSVEKGRSRRQRWHDKQRAVGRCACGREPISGKKSCARCLERVSKWQEENGDKVKSTARSRREAIRTKVITGYGGQCACCGEAEPMFLSIDHINNDGKSDPRRGGDRLYRWLIEQGYPAGYQLLCRNCNWGKHVNGGNCPHKAASGQRGLVNAT